MLSFFLFWPHRITASPPDSQSGCRGSIPRGAARCESPLDKRGLLSVISATQCYLRKSSFSIIIIVKDTVRRSAWCFAFSKQWLCNHSHQLPQQACSMARNNVMVLAVKPSQNQICRRCFTTNRLKQIRSSLYQDQCMYAFPRVNYGPKVLVG